MSKAADLANLIGNINAGGGGVGRNLIINGAMNVAQRATSATGKGDADGYFTCDRWHIDVGDTSAGRFTMSQDSSAPDGFANSLKIATTTADTSIAAGEKLVVQTKIEGQNAQTFAKGTSSAKPMALSFYVKGNASATYVAEIFDENSRQCSKTFNVTTDWTRIKLTFPADTTGALADDNDTALFVNFHLHAGSNFTSGTLNSSGFASQTAANRAVGISSIYDSTDRTFFLTGVQLEVGQNATEFEHEPFDVTLKKCYRYAQLLEYPTGHYVSVGFAYDTTNMRSVITYDKKRVAPSGTLSGTLTVFHSGNNQDDATISIQGLGVESARIEAALTDESTTAGYALGYFTTSAYTILLDAEL
mgnify:CR=1 FL=1